MLCPRRWMLAPQPVDQSIARHRLVPAEQQDGEQGPLPLTANRHELAVNAYLSRPKQAVIEHCRTPPPVRAKQALRPTVATGTGIR